MKKRKGGTAMAEQSSLSAVTEPVLPSSDHAEAAVLGCVLMESGLLYEINQIISAVDFYKDAHRKIYLTMLALQENGKEVDLVTVGEALKSEGILDAVGGYAFLTELSEAVPSPGNALSYARIVKDKALKRRLIAISTKITADTQAEERSAEELLDEAENAIYDLNQLGQATALKQVAPFVTEAYDRIGKEEKGIPTFPPLDHLIGGLKRGEMIIFAARPGMGKTTICLNIAETAATKYDATVAFFTLEMTPVQVASRMLFAKAKVDQTAAKKAKNITDEEFARLGDAMKEISAANLYIDDTSMITVAEIRGKLKKLNREKGLDLVVIDYIGLMEASKISKDSNRQQQISDISRQLKSLAKELNVPVIVISQLNRASVKNEGKVKEPDLSHLRESGALEQDADIVIFIHRPHYYDKENADENLAKIIVAKNRSGAVGTVELGFISKYTLFCHMDFDHEDPMAGKDGAGDREKEAADDESKEAAAAKEAAEAAAAAEKEEEEGAFL